MVKRSVLDQFVRLGGYDIVKKRENGHWKNISQASRKTGLSRPTIYSILKDYPERPNMPKNIEEFRETEGFKRLKELYEQDQFYTRILSYTERAWKFLNKKDPISWCEADFLKLWKAEQFQDQATNFINYEASLALRDVARGIERYDLLPKLPTKKKSPSKLLWYLDEQEIIQWIGYVEEIDVLMIIEEGLASGARISAILTTTPSQINYKDNVLMLYESKVNKWVCKIIPDFVLELLRRYIEDFNIKPDQRLYRYNENTYSKKLREAGERAGLSKKTSSHILKHTFISQAHRHGVSAETVVEQTGTQLRTINGYYRAVDERKIRHELLGEEYDPIPFYEWLKNLHSHFVRRYEDLWNGQK